MSKHPLLKPSPTRTPGSRTIDDVFGTPTLDVERAGYCPFYGFNDHRLSWLNIRWESALGLYQVIEHPLACRLQCDNPKSVTKYIQLLGKMLQDAGITAKVIHLEITVKISMSPEDMEQYEELDKCITKCMTHAEKSAGNYI